VATDQKSSVIDDEPAQTPPAIENELPTYRAISKRAIFSLVCGTLALFSFAHLYFLVFAILAVAAGTLANAAIKRHPDMLTGRRLANTGIVLGLVFGLVAFTYTTVQNLVLGWEAQKFGQSYAEVLKKGSLGDVLWHGIHPEQRKTKSPQDVLKEYETAQTKDRMMVDQRSGPILRLRKRLAASDDEHMHFVDIESQGMDESHGDAINYYALARFEVEGPGNKEFPEKQQYALAIFKGRPKGRHYEWWVEDVKFPYQPKSYVVTKKPADDGHGH